jgi:hypothetical protein
MGSGGIAMVVDERTTDAAAIDAAAATNERRSREVMVRRLKQRRAGNV